MDSGKTRIFQDRTPGSNISTKHFAVNERKMLKAVLLGCVHQLFFDIYEHEIHLNKNQFTLECYEMDNKIIQQVIQTIIDSKQYTSEGIACHTRVPLDVINEAASGLNKQPSITTWTRLIIMFMEVNPEFAGLLVEKLLELKDKNFAAFSLLLQE